MNDFEALLLDLLLEISNKNLTDNYCITVFTKKFNVKTLAQVYKNISGFKRKFQNFADKLDPVYGIDVSIWIYD